MTLILWSALLVGLSIAGAVTASLFVWHQIGRSCTSKALYTELVALRAEAGALAERLAEKRSSQTDLSGWRPSDAFFLYHQLSAPSVQPSLGHRLGLLPAHARERVAHFYLQLGYARERLRHWRDGGTFDQTAFYLLFSALTQAAWGIEPLLDEIVRHTKVRLHGPLEMRAATSLSEPLAEQMEREAPEWSVPAYWPFQ